MFKIHPEFDDDLLEDLAEAADSDGDDEINYEAYVRFVYDNILKLKIFYHYLLLQIHTVTLL